MYRMGVMTFLLDNKNELNRTKCMELGMSAIFSGVFWTLISITSHFDFIAALVHDLAESIVGDITPMCGVSKEEKQRREMAAMREISALIPPQGERLMELFEVCSLLICGLCI